MHKQHLDITCTSAVSIVLRPRAGKSHSWIGKGAAGEGDRGVMPRL